MTFLAHRSIPFDPMKNLMIVCCLASLVVLSGPGCRTIRADREQAQRAEVTIPGIDATRLQELVVQHMQDLGYRTTERSPGFLVLERGSGQPVKGLTPAATAKSRVQLAIQEVGATQMIVHAVEYSVYFENGRWVEKEATINQIFLQALLEGFKAKMIYGQPPR